MIVQTRLSRLIVAGMPPLAPRPATKLEKYEAIAHAFGIPWNAKTPHQLHATLTQIRFTLSKAIMPDGDPRPKENDADDESGDPEREVACNPEVSAGREDDGDEDD